MAELLQTFKLCISSCDLGEKLKIFRIILGIQSLIVLSDLELFETCRPDQREAYTFHLPIR
ncbi:hypothetical protein V6Z12_D13G089600 [Gossypium hirsutum]